MSADAEDQPATQGRGKIRFTIQGQPVEVPEGMTLLNAMQVAGYDYLKGCGCRMGDCGECAVYYRLPGSAVTLRDFSCEMRVAEGMEVMDVPFKWNLAFKQAQNRR
jgi:NADH dehydrogenase/NADH:ubiquinone oxidoreductase subunit G